MPWPSLSDDFLRLMGAAAGIWQACAFGLAGSLSPFFAQDLMFGQGVGGVRLACQSVATGLQSCEDQWHRRDNVRDVITWADRELHRISGFCAGWHSHALPHADSSVAWPYFDPLLQLRAVRAQMCSTKQASTREISTDGVTSQSSSPMLNRARSSGQILVQNAWPQANQVLFRSVQMRRLLWHLSSPSPSQSSQAGVTKLQAHAVAGVASRFVPGSHVPLLIAMFQFMDVVGRFAPQLSVRH